MQHPPSILDEVPRRSVLRYFGGKWALAPWILQHLPPHRIYVEPFGGAASVLLRKPRSKIEVYNDLDEEIVGVFQAIQNPATCTELMRRLRRMPYSRAQYELALQPATDPVERAARAIARSFMAFHPSILFHRGSRTFSDSRHRGGSGCNAHEWATYPRSLAATCRRLRGVLIERREAAKVIAAQDSPGTLFFVDPPYLPDTRGSGGGYRHEMDEAQHAALLDQLLAVRGRVVLAGYPSELYDGMLSGWQRIERPHRAAGSQRPRTEVLWINPAPPL